MKFLFRGLPIFFFGVLLYLVFHSWFATPEIIGGDWPFLFPESLASHSLYPSLWIGWLGNGLGGINLLLGLHMFQEFLIVPFTQWLGISWPIVYKVGWYGLFFALSLYGAQQLSQSLLGNTKALAFRLFSSVMFLTNTYVLMIVAGGQMGVALAYSVAPLVLSSFVDLIRSIESGKDIKYFLSAGLILGFQVLLDFRIAYVTMVGVGIYFIVSLLQCFIVIGGCQAIRRAFRSIVFLFLSSGLAVFLNAFWLLPQVALKTDAAKELGSAYTSTSAVSFFSFADFSHALSLLQPNWPENIFGKTAFLRPEFLALPIIAFSSLLFISKIKNQKSKVHSKYQKEILYLTLLALIGAFLAKGANEPLGSVYLWLFEHLPGFVLFRDPTKWYILIVLSYSMLIPFVLGVIGRGSAVVRYGTVGIFLLLWVIIHRQAFAGQLPGTFVRRAVPQEYSDVRSFIHKQPEFFRTLWVPRLNRFSFTSLDHPGMEAEPLFAATNAAQMKNVFEDPHTPEVLASYGIKYVVVPSDPLGELFVSDRKYDEKKRYSYEVALDAVPWLTKIQEGNLPVYQIPSYNNLFWLASAEQLQHKRLRQDFYEVRMSLSSPSTLFFSQRYHPGWRVLTDTGQQLIPTKTESGIMVVSVPAGHYIVKFFFEPQKFVTWGGIVSVIALALSLGGMVWFQLKAHRLVDL